MDNGGTKLPVTIPSSLETTMVRSAALVANGITPAPLPPFPSSAATPADPPGLAAAPTIAGLGHAFRRRWLLACMVATLGAVLTVAAVFVAMPPKYLAESRLLVASRSEVSFGTLQREDTEFAIFKSNLPSLLRAPLNLNSALNQKVSPTKFARDLGIVRDRGGAAVEWLERALKTDYNLGPEILKITLSAERGDETAELLNAVVQAFLNDLEQKERARAEGFIEQLQKKQEDLERELSRNRRQLVENEKAFMLPNLAEMKNKYDIAVARLSTIEKEHIKNELDRVQIKQELESLTFRLKNPDAVPVPDEDLKTFIRTDPRFTPLFDELAKAEKDLFQAARVAPNSPTVSAPYKEKRDRLQKSIDDKAEELRPELERSWRAKFVSDVKLVELAQADKLKSLGKQSELLNSLLIQARTDVERYTPGNQNIPAEILSLRDKIGSMERAVGKVQEEIIVLRANAAKTRVTLLQRATEPQDKDTSRQTKLAGAGGLGVFGLLLFGVAFLEFRSRKVGGASDVAVGLGMNVVGTLPPMPEPARKPLPGGASQYDAYWQNRLMESIDAIRTMLLHSARGDSLRVIMVTSAVGGEGKTSLASQLAASLARSWKRTLLVDGDLRNPATHRLFNVPLDPGFSEVLRGEVDVSQAIRATPVSRLWTMPAGQWDAHAVQALAQDQVRQMFQDFKQQYDFVIVDSCPVLPVADALLLGQHVDAVLFSVMRDVSRLPAVWTAQQRLQNLGIRTMGAVVIGDQGADLGASKYKYTLAAVGKK